MESLGRLAGGIAHDFNNLLTPILAYANMGLMQLDDGAPLFEELQEIHHAAERASGLIRQILTFSRKQPMQVQPVALSAVIEGSRANAAPSGRRRRHRVVLDSRPTLVT